MHPALLSLLTLGALMATGEFQAGVGRKAIIPTELLWMAGYIKRTKPFEGVAHDLWAKALAMEDAQGHRLVIVTADLISLPRAVCDQVTARVMEKYGLRREQLMCNASHTHCGPIVWPNLQIMCDGDDVGRQRLITYRSRLSDDLTGVIGEALDDLRPATLAYSHGTVGFVANRRLLPEKGYITKTHPNGPVDHDVPVIVISSPNGEPRVILFGYALHNTTLFGNGSQLNSDYAGFAQLELEKTSPGATAMFLMLCGGDQDPEPRDTLEIAAAHGRTLAAEVQRVLSGKLKPIKPSFRTAYEEVTLNFAHQDRAVFAQEARGEDHFRRRRAEAMLAAMDTGKDIWHVTLPVQAVPLGGNVALLVLGGEVVVDYSLRLKREYPHVDLIVAGYANDIPCYIPLLRMLLEGGYEPEVSMICYNKPGPFDRNVEDILISAVCRLLLQGGVPANDCK